MIKIGLFYKQDSDKSNSVLIAWQKTCPLDKIELSILNNQSGDDQVDIIYSFGGDGTILRLIERAILWDAPLVGFNLGKLGFLTDFVLAEIDKVTESLIQEKYRLQSLMLLDVKIMRNTTVLHLGKALNDVVLLRGSESNLINLKLYSDRQFVYNSRSDGLIISTPTGSTAYSLSAGGPILHQTMEAIMVTPLNPHLLTIYPMVFAAQEKIEIFIPFPQDIKLQIDGKNKCNLLAGDRVIIVKAKEVVKFVKLPQKSYYQTLRKKLRIGKK